MNKREKLIDALLDYDAANSKEAVIDMLNKIGYEEEKKLYIDLFGEYHEIL